jgi:hypothetical protein
MISPVVISEFFRNTGSAEGINSVTNCLAGADGEGDAEGLTLAE